MTAPGDGFRADPAVIDDAATGMAAAETTMQTFGEEIAGAAALASDAAGEGPLADVLAAFGTAGRHRAHERAREPRELSQAMRDSAEQYRARDGEAAGSLDAVPFGG
jgi:hypothetical protein